MADNNFIKTALFFGYLNILATQMYVSFDPYINTKYMIKF